MTDFPPPLPIPSVIERLVECGFPKSAIKIEYEDELQSEVIYLDAPTVEPTSTFECVRAAARSMYAVDVQFADKTLNQTYHSFAYERDHEEARATSREWLRSRGKLDSVPMFEPAKMTLVEYLPKLETLCGYAPGAALELFGSDGITLEPGARSFPISDDESAKFECIMHVIAASNLEEHGLRFGFVGNEQYREFERD